MLLHRGERHVVARREARDRGLVAAEQTRDDVTPRAVREGVKDAVKSRVREAVTYNHVVVRQGSIRTSASGERTPDEMGAPSHRWRSGDASEVAREDVRSAPP